MEDISIGISVKEKVLELLDAAEFEIALDNFPINKKAVKFLIAALTNKEQKTKWRAVRSLGKVVAALANRDIEEARVIIRRLMWSLNEESGGIGWGAPEAIGEILADHRGLAEEYANIFISYTRQDGNFLEYEPLQRGLMWGLGRFAVSNPDLARDAIEYLPEYIKSNDAAVRALAAWTFEIIESGNAKPDLVELQEMFYRQSE